MRLRRVNLSIISINLTILFIFLFFPPTLLFLYRNLKRHKLNRVDPAAYYPVYKDKTYSKELWEEFKKIDQYRYKSYVGWKYKPISLKYINIKGVYSNRLSSGESLNNSTWFFGGSTMFGSGAKDYGTIPSIYNLKTNNLVFNFGVGGWDSSQSLIQLIHALGDGFSPKRVVFYDGVNDIENGCRSDLKEVPSHGRENTISTAIRYKRNFSFQLKNFVLEPYNTLLRKVKKNGFDH